MHVPPPEPGAPPAKGIKGFLQKYGHLLWWAHSLYALGLGAFVVMFAAKGFSHARWLAIMLSVVYILLLVFFRVFGTGSDRQLEGRKDKVRFFVMTYVLKNMYQGMLFFLLPFYWRATTWGSSNEFFVIALGVTAILSTLDVVFDNFLLRWRVAASIFYFFTLFACTNLVVPALFPNSRTLATMLASAAIATLAFVSMHIPPRRVLKPAVTIGIVGGTVGVVVAVYLARSLIPPVSMNVTDGGVGTEQLESGSGRLKFKATEIHVSLVEELHGVTDVANPGGTGDKLKHVWYHEEVEVLEVVDPTVVPLDPDDRESSATTRLTSHLDRETLTKLDVKTGHWWLDVKTEDDQLVGRVEFIVFEETDVDQKAAQRTSKADSVSPPDPADSDSSSGETGEAAPDPG